MDPLLVAAVLLVVGIALLVAEAVLPSYGILGALAGVAILAAVVYCFRAGTTLGLAVLAIAVVASPFVFMWMMELWPKTPVGKRLVLSATVPQPGKAPTIPLGATGITVTELRPIGECDFDDQRVEVISEYGIISARTNVQVVAHEAEGRPVVKAADSKTA